MVSGLIYFKKLYQNLGKGFSHQASECAVISEDTDIRYVEVSFETLLITGN